MNAMNGIADRIKFDEKTFVKNSLHSRYLLRQNSLIPLRSYVKSASTSRFVLIFAEANFFIHFNTILIVNVS